MSLDDFNGKLEHLRACLYAPPSEEAWRAVLAALDAFGPPTEGDAALAWSYAEGALDGWPASVRAAPQRWLFDLQDQRDPPKPPAWSLVRSLRARDLPKPDLLARKLARGGWLDRITTLDLQGRRLEAETWRVLLETADLSRLETLDLGRCGLTSPRVHRLAALPLPCLRALSLSAGELSAAALGALAVAPWPKLARLDLSNLYAQPAAFVPLGSPAWRGALRELDLSSCALRDRRSPHPSPWVQAFAQAQGWERLEVLNLASSDLCAADLAALLGAELPALRRLSLGNNTLDGLQRADARPRRLLAHLEALDLASARLGDEGLAALVRDPAPRLRSLRLAGCALGPAGLRALGELRAGQLETLDLSSNTPRQEGLEALARADSLAHLKELDLSRCRLGPSQWAPLARAESLGQLERLILSENLPSKDDLRALLGCGALPSLGYLGLVGCKLDDATGAAALGHLGLPALKGISLAANQLGAAALGALAQAPTFARLDLLDLSHNKLGDAAIAQLTGAGLPPGLRVLRLASNQVTDAGARLLLDALPSARLAELDLSHNRLSPSMEERLHDGAAALGVAISAGYQSP